MLRRCGPACRKTASPDFITWRAHSPSLEKVSVHARSAAFLISASEKECSLRRSKIMDTPFPPTFRQRIGTIDRMTRRRCHFPNASMCLNRSMCPFMIPVVNRVPLDVPFTSPLLRGWPRFAPRFWALTGDQEYPLPATNRLLLSIARRPLRLDFHDAFFSQCIVAKAAPLPVLRMLA